MLTTSHCLYRCLYCCLQVEETEEGIDYSLLRKQETIYFYDDVVLYEDELADNGTAVLSVKIVSSQTWPLSYPRGGGSVKPTLLY